MTPEQYRVTGTRAPGAPHRCLLRAEAPGAYRCVCCGLPLFDPDAEFEPGAGWPSFHAPVEEDAVSYETDPSDAIVRTEVLCRRWDARLGHLLPDGPEMTGRRYCIDPAARELQPKDGGR